MEIKKIVVCGAGTMGSGIAQTAAMAGFTTILYEPVAPVLDNAANAISRNLEMLVQKQKIKPEEKQNTIDRIHFTSSIGDCIGDIVIEAIIEDREIKGKLFESLASINSASTILATNTSSLPVTDIAAGIPVPGRVLGMHFFNPPTLMKLVEVVTTADTTNKNVKKVIELARQLGKYPVLCKDSPGFIVNRVARPYYIEALRLAEEGLADFEKIDRLMENAGFKLGPFRLMDLIGNDVNYAVSRSVYDQLGKPDRLKPSLIQKEKVDQKAYGRKSGRGYYDYPQKS